MDNIRFVLIMAFAMLSILLWQAWQLDYGPKPPISAIEQPIVNTKADLPTEGAGAASTEPMNPALPIVETTTGQLITVKTDVFNVEIDTQGGTLVNLDLIKYPVDKKNTAVNSIRNKLGFSDSEKNLTPIRLFNNRAEDLFLAQSGLISSNDSAAAANHHSVFATPQQTYALAEGQNTLEVPLTWTDNQGLVVTKLFTFTRGDYAINLEQKISNKSQKPWSGRQYTQFVRTPYVDPAGNSFIRTYAGGVVYTEENKYQKVKFEDMADEDLALTTTGGWSAMIQHYFASAWVPPVDQENHLYTKALGADKFVIGSYSPNISVAPNTDAQLKAQLFAGPKIQPLLQKVAKGLDLTVDYGWLTIIAKYIYQLLNFIHDYIGNWGFSILGVTLCIKLLFFPLSAASYKSMAKMRKIQPKLKELQDRYKDDKPLFNQKMMAMYKEEGVNPLGGCLPVLVQIPVFISLYWVLVETVELRQAPFALWIQDLSAQDPYYILPILYGITMKIQQGLNPAPIDPIQAKIMKMFPIVFTFFFLFFPAGLVLYWIMNNTLSIIQQWYITKHIVGEEKTPVTH
ncbi:MAG: membrane protein insertase YidC [Methylococcaceae bacterium]|nr:membrane protein insertase YidC [Methylococcaceae bacterium]